MVRHADLGVPADRVTDLDRVTADRDGLAAQVDALQATAAHSDSGVATVLRRYASHRSRAMAFAIRRTEYFYATVREEPGAAHRILSQLAGLGVNLLAFSAVPVGPGRVELAIFPDDAQKLLAAARAAQLRLDGPHPALLVQGDDELGALASVHERLAAANVDVYSSTGVTDGRGAFGYVVYVREDQIERAAGALGL